MIQHWPESCCERHFDSFRGNITSFSLTPHPRSHGIKKNFGGGGDPSIRHWRLIGMARFHFDPCDSISCCVQTVGSSLKSAEVFKQLSDRLSDEPGMVKKVNAVYVFVITQGGKEAAKYSQFFLLFVSPTC